MGSGIQGLHGGACSPSFISQESPSDRSINRENSYEMILYNGEVL